MNQAADDVKDMLELIQGTYWKLGTEMKSGKPVFRQQPQEGVASGELFLYFVPKENVQGWYFSRTLEFKECAGIPSCKAPKLAAAIGTTQCVCNGASLRATTNEASRVVPMQGAILTKCLARDAPDTQENDETILAYASGNIIPVRMHVPYWAKKPCSALANIVPLHTWNNDMIFSLETQIAEIERVRHDMHVLW